MLPVYLFCTIYGIFTISKIKRYFIIPNVQKRQISGQIATIFFCISHVEHFSRPVSFYLKLLFNQKYFRRRRKQQENLPGIKTEPRRITMNCPLSLLKQPKIGETGWKKTITKKKAFG